MRCKLTIPKQVGRIRTNAKLLNSKTCSMYHSTKHSVLWPGGRLRASPTVACTKNKRESADFLSVEHGFDEGVLPVAEGEQEEGGILPQ